MWPVYYSITFKITVSRCQYRQWTLSSQSLRFLVNTSRKDGTVKTFYSGVSTNTSTTPFARTSAPLIFQRAMWNNRKGFGFFPPADSICYLPCRLVIASRKSALSLPRWTLFSSVIVLHLKWSFWESGLRRGPEYAIEHKDYFELKTCKNQQLQEAAFSELPLTA